MSDSGSGFSSLPPLREIIARYDLRADKALGQNFLLDLNLTAKIARLADLSADMRVFEIGPGPGGLTRALLETDVRQVTAIEYDPRAITALAALEEHAAGRLTVIQADALGTDLTALAPAGPRAIVANLPYNIATPLLIGWLRQIREDHKAFDSMTLMVQQEVAERIAAAPGGKAYGRLSVLCQWLCDVKIVMVLPPQAFTPPPKVRSAVVRFAPRPPDRLPGPPFAAVEAVTAAAFGQRRKMVRSSLKDYQPHFAACGIDPAQRAETIPVAAYIALARAQN